MNYKLFDDFITLQALLKELGIIQSGGAIKAFLANETVLFNGEEEKRRGKKIRINDQLELPNQGIHITIVAPSQEEMDNHKEEQAEKARVAQLVKEMNKGLKKEKATPSSPKTKSQKPAVRFPGT